MIIIHESSEYDTFTTVTMRLLLALFAVSAIMSLGQAHQFSDFGKGPLHEDIQDILDLIPAKEIGKVCSYYLKHDTEIQDLVEYLKISSLIKDFVSDFQSIPEVLNLFNYLQAEGVDIYYLMNKLNKCLGIKELVPPSLFTISFYLPPNSLFTIPKAYRKTGGMQGLFREIRELLNYDDFITTYAQKIKSSLVFVDFIKQIKSDNFQQIVNKVYEIKSFQIMVNSLKFSGMKLHIVEDILLVVFGITVPNIRQERTLEEELMDFFDLLPKDKFFEVFVNYMSEDEQVRNAFFFMFTHEFHALLRTVEALDEYKAFVLFMQKAGIDIIRKIQDLHMAIGMEDYMPPKMESLLNSPVGALKIGEGWQAMLKDLYALLPVNMIDVVYRLKLRTSKVFSEFIAKLKSPKFQEIITNLYINETYKNFIMQTKEQGLDFYGLTKVVNRIFGIKFPY